MTDQIETRLRLALTGALGGALVWGVIRAAETDRIGSYPALVLFVGLVTLFGGLLGMAGPIGFVRAGVRSVGLGLVVAGLVALTGLRYATADDFFEGPMPTLATFAVATLPIPFLIAGARSGWREYPELFHQSWSFALRYAAAAVFTGLVWLVLFLSHEVLWLVGISVIGDLIEHELVALVLSGAVFGLGVAVNDDLAELLSPHAVLRLVRLFLPVVLVVMAVFLVALPFRGLDGLAGGLSPALLLLTMVAGGVSLVAITVDRTDVDATQSPVLRQSARAMSLVLPVMAALAGWALWLRIADYGWSPERLFMALLAGLGLAYGLVYAVAVVRGAAWMEGIRRANVMLALGVILLAALWLTPVLNAERISAHSQLARFETGETPVEELDVYELRSWGKPGAEALAVLEAKAKEPGQDALAAHLAGEIPDTEEDRAILVGALRTMLSVQPATATGTRDTLLSAADIYQLEDWTAVCKTALVPGQSACLMVVADLLPARPGEEAVLFLQRSADYVEVTGVYLDDAGRVTTRTVQRPDGRYLDAAMAVELMRAYQDTPPPVTAAPLNQLGTGDGGLIILP
jgi:hypothetical protein